MFKRLFKGTSSKDISTMTTASLLGLHLVSGIIVGGLMGYGIDYWLESSPRGLLIGVLIGILAGFKNLYTDAKRLIEKQKSDESKK